MQNDASDQRRLEAVENFAFGDREDPNDFGAKGDLKQIKGDVSQIQKDVSQIFTLIKWAVGLTMGMVFTAVLNLVIKAG